MSQRREMRTHSFRLEADVLEKLSKMAERERVSTNTVVSRYLRQMVEFSEIADRMGIVGMARSVLIKLMEFLNEKQAEEWGREAAAGVSREFELGNFGKESLEGFLTLLRLGEQYTRNYVLTQNVERDGSLFLVLNHHWGRKWSIYYYGAIDERLRALEKQRLVKTHVINYTDNQVTTTIVQGNASGPLISPILRVPSSRSEE